MPRSEGTLEIHFGLLYDSVSKQIKEEGYPLPKNIEYFDKCFTALNQLRFLITDSQYSAIAKRLNKEIQKAVQEKINNV